ncbi:MAG: cell division protein FtsW [Clostridia bacterium]|nr:cell division protein FtsW [Clostridia bacterium]
MKQLFKTNKKVKSKGKNKIDYRFFSLLLIILFLGSVMVFSASYPYASSHFHDGFYYVKRQAVFLAIGFAILTLCVKIPLEIYRKITPWFYGICLLLLVIVLFGGFSEGVAKRWLGIPNTPLSFQPSELMKLGVIMMLSWYYDRRTKTGILYELILPGIILFVPAVLVLLEKHLSGTIIVALIGLSIIFVAGTKIKGMIFTYGGVALTGGALFLLTNSYAMKRIESFLNPTSDILTDKWQTTQGLYAIGSGGLWGTGFFNSLQKYSYVSEPQNDFIFTIWCEETGFLGAVLLITLFLLLVLRGIKISIDVNETFPSLIALGITAQIGIQAFLNMLVVTDLIPNTGISLPFFSYGGSSLVILLAEMGILLSVSKSVKFRK